MDGFWERTHATNHRSVGRRAAYGELRRYAIWCHVDCTASAFYDCKQVAAPLAQTAPPDRASEQGAALAAGDVELQIHDMLPKSLVVRSDGTITLTEGDHSERETVAPRELAELNRAIEDSDFSALQQDYPGTICCDFIAHTITVTTPGRTHTVYCYNECPEAFDRVKDAILRLWPGTIEYQGWA